MTVVEVDVPELLEAEVSEELLKEGAAGDGDLGRLLHLDVEEAVAASCCEQTKEGECGLEHGLSRGVSQSSALR